MVLGTFSRPYLQTQEPFRETATQPALERNPVRFAGLMDLYGVFPFGKNDVDGERLAGNVNSGAADMGPYRSLFDREPAGDAVSLRIGLRLRDVRQGPLAVRNRGRLRPDSTPPAWPPGYGRTKYQKWRQNPSPKNLPLAFRWDRV